MAVALQQQHQQMQVQMLREKRSVTEKNNTTYNNTRDRYVMTELNAKRSVTEKITQNI